MLGLLWLCCGVVGHRLTLNVRPPAATGDTVAVISVAHGQGAICCGLGSIGRRLRGYGTAGVRDWMHRTVVRVEHSGDLLARVPEHVIVKPRRHQDPAYQQEICRCVAACGQRA